MTIENETPAQVIATEFNMVAEAIPDHYARVAQAMTEHAKADNADVRARTAAALAEALITAPPNLLDCLSENLKRVNHPSLEVAELAHATAVATESEMFFYTDQAAQINGLDEVFWQTIVSECAPLTEQAGKASEFNAHPISISVNRTPLNLSKMLVKLTATTRLHKGKAVIGRAIAIDTFKQIT